VTPFVQPEQSRCFFVLFLVLCSGIFSPPPPSLDSFVHTPFSHCTLPVLELPRPTSPSSNQPTNQPTDRSQFMLFFCNLLVFGISFKKNSQFFAITKTPQEISYTREKNKNKKRERREKGRKGEEKKSGEKKGN